MKKLVYIALIFFLNTSCGSRKIDWKKEWSENRFRLEKLKNDILEKGDLKYQSGNNHFPDEFGYPFDDGFSINSYNGHIGIDTKKTTITFYMDRGLLDHYSAIVFTNDSTVIAEMDANVKNGGNDFKIKENWYAVND
ncbi:hypothetical protein [Fluviicola sp.]|uniref:hypothetical protein n=1 Tax=Fluviicola sp. TaxID=1917219 RepID=UPI0031DCDB24